MINNISTDKIVGIGLVSALILSICIGNGSELPTNIASGLIGYLSKGYIEHEKIGKHERKGDMNE